MKIFWFLYLMGTLNIAYASKVKKIFIEDKTVEDENKEKEEFIDLQISLEKINSVIDSIKKMIRKSLNESYLPDLYFRLAELYVTRSRMQFDAAYKINAKNHDTQLAEVDAKNAVATKISKELAIETYSKIIKDFPDFKHIDQCYFFKAHEYREMNLFEQALNIYDVMYEKFPKSVWTLTSRFILGEHFFSQNNLDTALQYYQSVKTDRYFMVLAMAKNRIGWIHLYQQNNTEALKSYEESIRLFDKVKDKYIHRVLDESFDLDTFVHFREDSVVSSAWAYAKLNKSIQNASAYFKNISDNKKTFAAAMRKLGDRYLVENQPIMAARAFVLALENSFDGEKNTDIIEQIISLRKKNFILSVNNVKDAEDEVVSAIETAEQLENRPIPFKTRPDAPIFDEKKIKKNIEIFSRYNLTQYQSMIQKNNADESLLKKPYDHYLRYFISYPHFQAMQKNAAMAHFNSHDYISAGKLYESILNKKNSNDIGFEIDLYQTISAYASAIEQEQKNLLKDKKNHHLKRIDLYEAKEAVKTLGAIYLKNFPQQENASQVLFQLGFMTYQQGDFDQSVHIFRKLIKKYPKSSEVMNAANLSYDALYKIEDYNKLEELSKEVLNNPFIQNDKVYSDAKKILDNTKSRKVDNIILSNDNEDITSVMVKAFDKSKNVQEGEVYLLSAIQRFKEQKDAENIIALGMKYIKNFPNSNQSIGIMQSVAQYAMLLGDLELAAEYYWKIAHYYEKRKDKKFMPYLYRSFLIYESIGNTKMMEKAAYLLLYYRFSEHKKIREQLIHMYVGTKSWQSILNHLNDIADNKDQDYQGHKCVLAGIAYLGLEDGKALDNFQCALKNLSKNKNSFYSLYSLWGYSQILYRNFKNIHFSEKANIEKTLKEKLSYFNKVEKQYNLLLKSNKSSFVIPVVYGLGLLYRDFYDFILSSPAIGVQEKDKKSYLEALKKQASPYLSRNQSTWKACRDKSYQLNIFNDYVLACMGKEFNYMNIFDVYLPRDIENVSSLYIRNIKSIQHKYSASRNYSQMKKDLIDEAIRNKDYRYAYALIITSSEGLNAYSKNKLGIVLWHLKHYQEASKYLQESIQMKNHYAEINFIALKKQFGYINKDKNLLINMVNKYHLDTKSNELHENTQSLLAGKNWQTEQINKNNSSGSKKEN